MMVGRPLGSKWRGRGQSIHPSMRAEPLELGKMAPTGGGGGPVAGAAKRGALGEPRVSWSSFSTQTSACTFVSSRIRVHNPIRSRPSMPEVA